MNEQARGEAREATYDAVIVGGGMGGLTTGALLARAGRKVLVVDDHERPGGHAHVLREDGYTFDSAVHLITRCGQTPLLGTGLVDGLLRHLGVRDRCEFLRVDDPFYTVHFPGLRVAVPTGREAFLAAHVQHFPDEAAGLRRLHELSVQVAREAGRFPENPGIGDLFLSRWRYPTLFRYRNATMQEVVDRELRDPRLKMVYSALWFWVGSPPWRASFLAWANMMAQYIEDGAYYCRGGFQTLADAVALALERAGGELLLGTRVTKIHTSDGRARGVVLETGQTISAPVVISNADPPATFQQLLGASEAPARVLRQLRRLELTIPATAAYLATDLDVRSLGLGHETLYNTSWDLRPALAAAADGETPGLSITIPTLTDPSLAPPGQHIVILMALAPTAERVRDAELAERMLALAEPFLPGLRDHLTAVVGAPPGAPRQLAIHRFGPVYGAAMTPHQMGARRMSHGTPIEGLHLVGQWTRPGIGVPWVMESGLQVARLVLGRSAAAARLPNLVPVVSPA